MSGLAFIDLQNSLDDSGITLRTRAVASPGANTGDAVGLGVGATGALAHAARRKPIRTTLMIPRMSALPSQQAGAIQTYVLEEVKTALALFTLTPGPLPKGEGGDVGLLVHQRAEAGAEFRVVTNVREVGVGAGHLARPDYLARGAPLGVVPGRRKP